ncbi:MAG: hypothetical protein QHJ73_07480 [Armatimonadota bacterium]|nr:hypothetical protein [Armatimonadota bacterium]
MWSWTPLRPPWRRLRRSCRGRRLALEEVQKAYRSIDSAYKLAETLKERIAQDPDALKRKYNEVEEKVKALPEVVGVLRTEAEKAGLLADPQVAQAIARVAEEERRLAKAREEAAALMAQNAAGAAQATADVAAFEKVYAAYEAEVKPVVEMPVRPGEEISLADARKQAALLDRFAAGDADLKAKLDAFAARYGRTEDEITAKLEAAGYAGQAFVPARHFVELSSAPQRAAKAKSVMAEALARQVMRGLDPATLKGQHDFRVAETPFTDYREMAALAVGLDPENALARQASTEVDGKIAGAERDFAARVDARVWPRHAAAAPANAAQLAAAAMQWMRESAEWGRRNQNPRVEDKAPRVPLAVTITGPWNVQERNLLGQPTMYGLPVLVAVQLDREKSRNLARVYQLTLCTAQYAGVKAAPPFDSARVGDSYFVRPGKVSGNR